MDKFKLVSKFKPMGDQPEAIDKLVKGFQRGKKEQTLLGVTGSGKTFTMANIIKLLQHSYTESLKSFFPTMLWNILYRIMIITSRRHMCRQQIHI